LDSYYFDGHLGAFEQGAQFSIDIRQRWRLPVAIDNDFDIFSIDTNAREFEVRIRQPEPGKFLRLDSGTGLACDISWL